MKVISVLILLTLPFYIGAQNKMIKGNGRNATELKTIAAFDELYIDLFCDVYVSAGSMPKVEISGDKNVINKISMVVLNRELRIEVKDGYWLQATRPQIFIQTPYLTKITTKGQQTNIGNIKIDGIKVDNFEANLFYGEVRLEGVVNKLNIRSSNRNYYDRRSNLDASQLAANEVDVHIEGSNTALVFATEKLSADLKHDAVLKYVSEPKALELSGKAILLESGLISVMSDSKEEPIKKTQNPVVTLQYVELKVKNNTFSRKHFVIKGPNGRGDTFSYGFPMMPLATRDKKVPVGTEIFLQENGQSKKKLITITAKDNGKVVQLFSK